MARQQTGVLTWVARAKHAWPVALTVSVCVLALATGAIVRREFRLGQGFWIVQPVLYLAHSEHRADSVPWELVAFLPVLVVALIWTVRRVDRPLRPVPELLTAIALGGVLANVAEVLARASVTDFLGVHGPNGGLYSAGDIAINTGVALIPVAGFALIRPEHGTVTGLLAGGALSAAAILLAVVLPNRLGLAFLVTIVAMAAVASLATRTLLSKFLSTRAAKRIA